jgi:sulfur transfer complex TusBCD TusB component (DsrH family)
MASILVALISSPETPGGRRALSLAESLAIQGHAVTLCCVQDAVLLGSSRAPRPSKATLDRLLGRGARCMVLGEDLASRGLEPGPAVSMVDHMGLVTALAADHDRIIGAL